VSGGEPIYAAGPAGIERLAGAGSDGPLSDVTGLAGVAVSSDGNTLYAAKPTTSSIVVIDATDGALVRTISLPGLQPSGVAVSPDGETLYVVGSADGSIAVVDALSGFLRQTIPAPTGLAHASEIALTDDGALLYVADNVDGTVWTADTATLTTTVVIRGLRGMTSLAAEDDLTAYVGIGGSAPAVATIDVAHGSVVRSTRVAAAPTALAIWLMEIYVAEPTAQQLQLLELPSVTPVADDMIAYSTVGKRDTAIYKPLPGDEYQTYQWYADGEPIPGATSRSVVLGPAQLGTEISVKSYAHAMGMAPDFNLWTIEGLVMDPMSPSVPTIVGRATVGRTVRAHVSSWGAHTHVRFAYQWYAGSRAIKGATKPTFKVSAEQTGRALRLRLTGRQYRDTRNVFSRSTRTVKR
jgi:hypothetical protein